MESTHVDNLIIGAGLVGSIVAWHLAERGERGVLLERNSDPGGVNGSFTDPDGNVFDHGRHVINADRSAFVSEFFHRTLGGRVRRFTLQRGIVVRGYLMPYAAPPEAWPEALRSRLEIDPSAPPVYLGSPREAFARAYGRWFADLVFDEMLDAYPVLTWKREHGMPEEQLLDWLFPWFFPRTSLEGRPETAAEQGVYSDESRNYHYERRHTDPPAEEALYPEAGGFGGWVRAMLDASTDALTLHLGLGDIDVDIDPDTLAVRAVTAGGRHYTAERVFWCAPLPALCRLLGWGLPAGEPQWELLGSFTFERPLATDYHEILFADPRHRIRRIHYPGHMAGAANPCTLQVEFTTLGGEAHEDADAWRDRWLASLRSLGLINAGDEPRHFDLRRVSRGVVSTEDLGAFLNACEDRIAHAGGNLVAPHLAVASDNNARLVPKVCRRVEAALAGTSR